MISARSAELSVRSRLRKVPHAHAPRAGTSRSDMLTPFLLAFFGSMLLDRQAAGAAAHLSETFGDGPPQQGGGNASGKATRCSPVQFAAGSQCGVACTRSVPSRTRRQEVSVQRPAVRTCDGSR